MATPSWSTDFPSSLPIGQIFNSYINERYFVNKSTNTLAVPPCLMELPLETASDDTGWVKRRKNAYFWPIKRRKRNISETMKDKHKVTIENYQELACTRASFRVVSILWRWMTSHWTIIAHPPVNKCWRTSEPLPWEWRPFLPILSTDNFVYKMWGFEVLGKYLIFQ